MTVSRRQAALRPFLIAGIVALITSISSSHSQPPAVTAISQHPSNDRGDQPKHEGLHSEGRKLGAVDPFHNEGSKTLSESSKLPVHGAPGKGGAEELGSGAGRAWEYALFHRKEDSPVHCSRAVSRWVREAWEVVLRDALSLKGKEKGKGQGEFDDRPRLSPSCPLGREVRDLYSEQEPYKVVKTFHGPAQYECGKCSKTFKSEYHIDRHLDRRHSFPFELPDDYRGGSVAKYPWANSSAIDLSRIRRWGVCLEDYCSIFDVCDRPISRRFPVLLNNLSVTYLPPPISSKHSPSPSVHHYQHHHHHHHHHHQFHTHHYHHHHASHYPYRSIHQHNTEAKTCDQDKLTAAHNQCLDLVGRCFPVTANDEGIRRANVYLKINLCGALSQCSRYLTRRLYSGSHVKFREAAYLGQLTKPLSAMPGWQIGVVVMSIVAVVFVVIVILCCLLDSQDLKYNPPPRQYSSDPSRRNYAYRSTGMNRPTTSPPRRRLIGDPRPTTATAVDSSFNSRNANGLLSDHDNTSSAEGNKGRVELPQWKGSESTRSGLTSSGSNIGGDSNTAASYSQESARTPPRSEHMAESPLQQFHRQSKHERPVAATATNNAFPDIHSSPYGWRSGYDYIAPGGTQLGSPMTAAGGGVTPGQDKKGH